MATPIEVLVPDIGGFADVSVIDVLVKEGQQIDKETPLITIETEKAAMDVPAPAAGRITKLSVKNGDKVSQGSLILLLETSGAPEVAVPVSASTATAPATGIAPVPATATAPATGIAPVPATAAVPATAPAARASAPATTAAPAAPLSVVPLAASIDEKTFSTAHASPSVRKFARELGANLGSVTGTGPKGRITQDDVKAHVKKILSTAVAPVSALPKVPVVDFSLFGPTEIKPLSRIQKISGLRLQASWINLPHVTQHDEADITELEVARTALKSKALQESVRLTPLAFIVRACLLALKEFPNFNSSLNPAGDSLVLKKYFNIGFAADTPNGLVVPVIANADRCSLYDIARALSSLSEKARAGKLTAAEMQGGSFTISSLGGIGGTAFTPIINAPEVAILGVSRSSYKAVYEKGAFVPRLMLPLSLSYDHRVIDGAAAARFVVFVAKALADVKNLL